MVTALAVASLRRHRARTLLAVFGIAIAAAMLLDMVMLATGMRESFRQLIDVRGYQLRVTPLGTLPFDSEATIADASAIREMLGAHPEVVAVSPVLGTAVHAVAPGDTAAFSAFGLGVLPAVQGDYELRAGRHPLASNEVVLNRIFLERGGVRLGDTLALSAGYDPQLRAVTGRRTLRVVGEAHFFYLAANQPAAALPLSTLQAMGGSGGQRADRVSLLMVRVRDGADVEGVRQWIADRVPRVTALSTTSAMAMVDERLSYFRQLAFILGSVSLSVGFLLVTTLVTVSVNERIGEIAVMRAIGVRRGRIVQQVVLEGFVLSAAGAALGLLLGLVTARWLNAILSDFPGMPAAIDFFLFQPRAAAIALGLIIVSGFAAGAYPAWRAASLPIAGTLRREAVA